MSACHKVQQKERKWKSKTTKSGVEITGVLLEEMRRNESKDQTMARMGQPGKHVTVTGPCPRTCPSIHSLPVCSEYPMADSGICYSLLYPVWPSNPVFLKPRCLSPAPGLLCYSNYPSWTLVGSLPGSLSFFPQCLIFNNFSGAKNFELPAFLIL